MTDDTEPTKQQDSPSALNDGLDRFLALEPGWDSYGGQPISPTAISKAKELITFLPTWGWRCVPCPDGSVQIEMHQDGVDIEISVVSSNAVMSRAVQD